MRRVLIIIMLVAFGVSSSATNSVSPLLELSPYERAIRIIKYYETLHQPKHWPTIGYGHTVKQGEPYKRGVRLTEEEADALLRKDMNELCDYFQQYGSMSILLACLSYNCGLQRVLDSDMFQKIKAGNRNILSDYLSFCHYNGKSHSGILRRRWIEYSLLYESSIP